MRDYRRSNIKPNTLVGEVNWRDYTCSVDVFIKEGNVELGGRVQTSYLKGYRFQLEKDGNWKFLFHQEKLAEGKIENFDGNIWHKLKLSFKDKTVEAFVDGELITTVTHENRTGYVMLASSYDLNLFDNLEVSDK